MKGRAGSSGQRWVVGTHACLEALKTHPDWVSEVAILDGRSPDPLLEPSLQRFKKQTKSRNKKFFSDLSEVHQGIAVKLTDRPQWQPSEASRQVVAMLDGLNDPHNLGAILRSAWLFDVKALFIPKNRTVSLTPTVCKIACGGAEHVPVEEVHFQSQIDEFKKQGFWVYGLSEKAKVPLPQMSFAEKSVLVIGAEGSGLRSSTLKQCDELVAIPQVDAGASLNASIAFAVVAYECRRQASTI